MTRASETVPVLTQYDLCQTRSKLMTTGRTPVFTRIHMKTHTDGAVLIMNQYDMCQQVQKWFLVCWVILVGICLFINNFISEVKMSQFSCTACDNGLLQKKRVLNGYHI